MIVAEETSEEIDVNGTYEAVVGTATEQIKLTYNNENVVLGESYLKDARDPVRKGFRKFCNLSGTLAHDGHVPQLICTPNDGSDHTKKFYVFEHGNALQTVDSQRIFTKKYRINMTGEYTCTVGTTSERITFSCYSKNRVTGKYLLRNKNGPRNTEFRKFYDVSGSLVKRNNSILLRLEYRLPDSDETSALTEEYVVLDEGETLQSIDHRRTFTKKYAINIDGVYEFCSNHTVERAVIKRGKGNTVSGEYYINTRQSLHLDELTKIYDLNGALVHVKGSPTLKLTQTRRLGYACFIEPTSLEFYVLDNGVALQSEDKRRIFRKVSSKERK